jgi:hypothetical protein
MRTALTSALACHLCLELSLRLLAAVCAPSTVNGTTRLDCTVNSVLAVNSTWWVQYPGSRRHLLFFCAGAMQLLAHFITTMQLLLATSSALPQWSINNMTSAA